MPARDSIHDAVKNALEKDGWTITHDPLSMPVSKTQLLVDLAAERFVNAERGNSKIAVEIKTLSGRSPIFLLENALGQYLLYLVTLKRRDPERVPYLAIPSEDYHLHFHREPAVFLLEDEMVNLIVIDTEREEIETWIPEHTTET
jgi:hypothetical protein